MRYSSATIFFDLRIIFAIEIFFILFSKSLCFDRVAQVKYIPNWKRQACELPQSQNDQSHYICDSSGEVKCLPGWQGDLCDVPICRKGCDPMNGYCQLPDECRCRLGFYGEQCNKCIPLPGCHHGYCNVSFECKCKKGWKGLFCSEPICRKDCHPTRGYCEMPGECRCKLGWSGPTCHHCQILPGCQYGTCIKPLECKCLKGFGGLLCQIPICAKNCNRQHGYCRRPGECRCKVGWMGSNCSQCHPYPGCVNGICNNPWECICMPGWGGILCDEPLNFCELNPDTCKNGGKCISLEKADGSFRCLCSLDYVGKYCDVPMILNNNINGYIAPTLLINSTTHLKPMTSTNFDSSNIKNETSFTEAKNTTNSNNLISDPDPDETSVVVDHLNDAQSSPNVNNFTSKNLSNII